VGLFALFAAVAILAVPALAYAAPSEFDALRSRGWLWAYLGVFVAGVMTSLTPCVYPMIPIVMGVFGARGESVTRLRAVGLASMYVLGMGVMYSSLGMAVALTGKAFGSILANPWVIVPLVCFYSALAASMFGAFELNLPASWQGKLSTVGGKGVGGAFGMGLVGGLTAAPCTGPMLVAILAFVGTTRNVPTGFFLLFTFALGMGVLFWVIAAFAVALPKSGAWMESVKSVAGIALLVMGAYFLRPVWPLLVRLASPNLSFLASCVGVAAAGIALGGVHLSFHDAPRVKLQKAMGVALATLGTIGIVNWVLTPKKPLPWRHDPVAALAEAKADGKAVLVDFGAEWCAPCKEYEVKVFSDPVVHAEILDRFVPLKFDLTDGSDAALDAQEQWQAKTLPTVILVGTDAQEKKRLGEPIPTPDEFLAALRQVR
jgi:thiol:disulfide interchange protein DsbD